MADRMPVVRATAIASKDKRTKSLDYGQLEPYDCPVCRFPNRTDKYLVFRVQLRSDLHPWHLKLGALRCSAQRSSWRHRLSVGPKCERPFALLSPKLRSWSLFWWWQGDLWGGKIKSELVSVLRRFT